MKYFLLFCLAGIVACGRVAPSSAPTVPEGYTEVGNGGDLPDVVFAEGRYYAEYLLDRVSDETLHQVAPVEAEFIAREREHLTDFVAHSKHEWHAAQNPVGCPADKCGCTFGGKTVHFARPFCRSTNTKPEAARVLLHEAVHQVLGEKPQTGLDEDRANRVAGALLIAADKIGFIEAPHWSQPLTRSPLRGDLAGAHWMQTGLQTWSTALDQFTYFNPKKGSWIAARAENAPQAESWTMHTASSDQGLVAWADCQAVSAFSLKFEQKRWQPVRSEGGPGQRRSPFLALQGKQIFVFGGLPCPDTHTVVPPLNDGAVYDLETGQWRAIPPRPVALPTKAAFALVAGKLITWGGYNGHYKYTNRGFIFDSASGQWSEMAIAGAPEGRSHALAVSNGRDLLIYGGIQLSHDAFANGALYSLSENRWTEIPSGGPAGVLWDPQDMQPAGTLTATWAGETILFLNAQGVSTYAPARRQWETAPSIVMPSLGDGFQSYWTGQQLLVTQGREVFFFHVR